MKFKVWTISFLHFAEFRWSFDDLQIFCNNGVQLLGAPSWKSFVRGTGRDGASGVEFNTVVKSERDFRAATATRNVTVSLTS